MGPQSGTEIQTIEQRRFAKGIGRAKTCQARQVMSNADAKYSSSTLSSLEKFFNHKKHLCIKNILIDVTFQIFQTIFVITFSRELVSVPG
jgi:hypothetical protein